MNESHLANREVEDRAAEVEDPNANTLVHVSTVSRRPARSDGQRRSLSAIPALLTLLSLATASDARADVASGELYGYRLGEVVEGCGQKTGELGWSHVPNRSLPAPFDETWALCTPLTHEVLSISARAHVERSAGSTLVEELVDVLDGKYKSENGWKHDTQSRELLGSYDSIDTFENADFLLRVSRLNEPAPTDGRTTIVEIQLDHSNLSPKRDVSARAEKERLELLRRAAQAKGLDKGL